MIKYAELIRSIEDLYNIKKQQSERKYFFTSGTGISDMFAIEYFRNIGDIIVVDRAGRMWRKGEVINV